MSSWLQVWQISLFANQRKTIQVRLTTSTLNDTKWSFWYYKNFPMLALSNFYLLLVLFVKKKKKDKNGTQKLQIFFPSQLDRVTLITLKDLAPL